MKIVPNKGFTLIELLVAMAVASIVMAVIVSAYQIQVRSKNTQEALTDMNQTARAALEIMTQEIRMAGCDPLQNSNARIIRARSADLIFSMDVNNDGGTNIPDGDCCDVNETIRFYLDNDADFDGINDVMNDECNLRRETGAGNNPDCVGGGVNGQPLARNVDALNFVYLGPDLDGDGEPDVLPAPVTGNDLLNIRSIQVTLVARAGRESGGFLYPYTDTETYPNQQPAGSSDEWEFDPPNDSFRRLRLTTTINCPNLGR
jgi:type IV pilus assembly protein PilW